MATLHVDKAATGANDGLSWADAFNEIQSAVSIAASGDTILVKDGVYAPVTLAAQNSIVIRSVNGWGNCVIDGGGTARCVTAPVYRAGPRRLLAIRGLILRNGYAPSGGGAYYAELYGCEVTGCRAARGGGLYESNAHGCLIHHNTAAEYGGGVYYGNHYNSTIVFNTGRSGGFYNAYFNCIYRFNRTAAGTEVNQHTASYLHSAGNSAILPYAESEGGNITADPMLADDFSLKPGSPCIGTGRLDMADTETDLTGNPRTTLGTVCMGCFEFKPDIMPTRFLSLGGKS